MVLLMTVVIILQIFAVRKQFPLFFFFWCIADLDLSSIPWNFLYLPISEKEEYKEKRRFLYGESMGGAAALLMHGKMPDYWDGAVLAAPMCKVIFLLANILVGMLMSRIGRVKPCPSLAHLVIGLIFGPGGCLWSRKSSTGRSPFAKYVRTLAPILYMGLCLFCL